MIDLKELEKTINYLNELKKQEEKKQLETLKEEIKKEIIKELEDCLYHFESKKIMDFREETKKLVTFNYNFADITKTIKNIIDVDTWEVN